MTLTELRYIVALAQERHFGRAAQALYISQPTLSVALKKLEQELGVMLFERNKSDVVLTPLGEKIVQQAQSILEQSQGLLEFAKQGQDPLRGPLRVGAIYTIAPYLLPPLIPHIHELAPDMPLVLEENFTARLAERLRQGELDVAIVALPFTQAGIVTLPLYDEPFVALLPAAHPWRERDTIAIHELAQESMLLLGRGHCFRDQVVQACPECQDESSGELRQTTEGSSLETIRQMVATGMGVTVLPCSAAGAAHYAQRLVVIKRLQAPVPTRRVALAWRSSFPRPKAIEALRQAILGTGLSCVRYLDVHAQAPEV